MYMYHSIYLFIYRVPRVLHPLTWNALSAFDFNRLTLFTVMLSTPHHNTVRFCPGLGSAQVSFLVPVAGFLECAWSRIFRFMYHQVFIKHKLQPLGVGVKIVTEPRTPSTITRVQHSIKYWISWFRPNCYNKTIDVKLLSNCTTFSQEL